MSEKRDALAGALASPMELTVGGVDLIVRPITLGDLGDMENWVRSQRMKAFREATEGMD
jgi:hypothetical protein